VVRDNEGPGLYVVAVGTRLSCAGCTLRGNQFAGAVTLDGGVLEMESSEIAGTAWSADLGGGVGVWAAQQWDLGASQSLTEPE
jgi:hypothetical protein